jgi:hypothetical protein
MMGDPYDFNASDYWSGVNNQPKRNP